MSLVLPLHLIVALDEPRMLFGQEVHEATPMDADGVAERRASFEAMLAERNWIELGDQVGPASPDGGFLQPTEPVAAWTTPPHRATIFLNFFGTDTLSPGTNSALDESSCLSGSMSWPGFGGTEQQALALIEVFETQMAPYGIRIAYDERPPAHLPYAMVMMGGTPQLLGLPNGVLGVSCSSDCGDFWWRDTTFAFTDAINPDNAEVLGTTALHEAAHAFGLAHIDDSSKIMHPFVGSGDVTWEQTCTPYNDATGGINCMPTHDEFCGGGAQNSHAELLAYFGENSPDIEAPSVEILSPADGAEFEVGSSVTVEAEVSDDHEGVGWKLVIPEVDQEAVAFSFETSWPLGNLPAGVYTLRVEAIDHERNEAVDEVTIYVGMDAPEPSDTSGGAGSSSGSEGTSSPAVSASDGPDDSSDGSSGGSAAQQDDVAGCGCRGGGPAELPSGAAIGLLGVVVCRRRR